ncbi:uncharacterized protein EDB93DRAFT_1096639, partial [Suillus bovinus]|uniref:uncharacterized protein n=1 Tax=Suillus bovinus TaxID=48563 RepID=UPI001B8768B3
SLELSNHDVGLRPKFGLFEAILKVCPLLQRLVIMDSGPILFSLFEHNDAISLPNIKEFHFGFSDMAYTEVLLSRLDAPNLVTLSIEDLLTLHPLPSCGSVGNTKHLLNYCATGFSEHPLAIPRSSVPFPKLQWLLLHRVVAPINAFRPLVSIPELCHLLLVDTTNVLAALILELDSTTPHPALESIQVFPITQEEVSRLQVLNGTHLVFQRDEESNPSRRDMNLQTVLMRPYPKIPACVASSGNT